jgi:putative aminopeptidase FrvX
VDSTERLLKELTEAHGVSGFEHEIQAVMRRYLQPLGEMEHVKLLAEVIRRLDEKTVAALTS